ncbi:MAG: AAA family ATPase [Candidatus Omnitrophica bacterium]|nr:AAA family ATPase [Candidatus Omnitrophota bacterium]MBU1127970.1 AAA family ATPase [Candidatus Omnitrophota bacterium]MBU1851977.1 AAA family ATPase [Candidatus Omnitrophota bacterium]
MKVISVVNQKGGCGKTTLAVNVAAALARTGYETLLIDLDPQAHATFAMGAREKAPDTKTSYDIFRSRIEDEEILPTELLIADRQKLDFMPANMLLSAAEINLGSVSGAATILSRYLTDTFFLKYDYVIIDSPPSFGFLTLNSMYSADMMIVPIDLSYFSFNGVNSIYRVVSLLNKETGRRPDVFFALNIFDGRSNFARDFEKEAKEKLGRNLFDTRIRSSVRLREAPMLGKTIFEHDPKCNGAIDFYNLTCELINIDRECLDTIVREFVLRAPKADQVYVLGDFNGWKKTETNRLMQYDDGKWSIHLNLKKGKYRYKYMVDGQWMHDPDNVEVEANIFGSIDSIISI